MARFAVRALLVCLLLTLAVDPSNGSAADIQQADTGTSSVVASGNVSTSKVVIPTESAASTVVRILVIAVCLVALRRIFVANDDRTGDPVLSWAHLARRGPPALA
ncbi:MAG: hypothetical protein AB7L84_06840 [Acidimicrobiia bacterium]